MGGYESIATEISHKKALGESTSHSSLLENEEISEWWGRKEAARGKQLRWWNWPWLATESEWIEMEVVYY